MGIIVGKKADVAAIPQSEVAEDTGKVPVEVVESPVEGTESPSEAVSGQEVEKSKERERKPHRGHRKGK